MDVVNRVGTGKLRIIMGHVSDDPQLEAEVKSKLNLVQETQWETRKAESSLLSP
jgi:hypothetical protein